MKRILFLTLMMLGAAVVSNMAVAEDVQSPEALVIEYGQVEVVPPTEGVLPEGDLGTPLEDVEGILHADAHDDGHGEKKKGLPQLDPKYYPSQIFWLTFTFLCMYLLFSKKILPEMSSTIEGRRQHIQENLDSAEDLKKEAESVHEAYDKIMQESHDKATQMFLSAENDIKKKTTKKIESFQLRASKSVGELEVNIQSAKADAMKDMHSIAAETARIAAEKIIGVSTDLKQAESVVKNLDKKAA